MNAATDHPMIGLFASLHTSLQEVISGYLVLHPAALSAQNSLLAEIALTHLRRLHALADRVASALPEITVAELSHFADTNAPAEGLPVVTETVLETLVKAWESFLAHTPYLVAGLVIVLLTWAIAKAVCSIARRGLKKSKFRGSLQDLLVRMASIAVWVAGLMLAAIVVFPGLSPAKALGGLGLASVAVGFAFKDIFENFFAGFVLLWRYPFENGDFIECEGVEGKILNINLRMSEIRQTTGELVVVPNSILFSNPVDVLTNLPRRRASIEVGVSYDTDVEEAVPLIRKTVEGCDSVMGDQPVQIFPKAFGSSSIDIEVAWWTKPKPLDMRSSRGEVVSAIKRALDDAGIEIPFPYRTHTFKEPIPLAESGGEAGA